MNKTVLTAFYALILGISCSWFLNMFDVDHVPLLIFTTFISSVFFFIHLKIYKKILEVTIFLTLITVGILWTNYQYQNFTQKYQNVCHEKKCIKSGIIFNIKENTIERTVFDIETKQGEILRFYTKIKHPEIKLGNEIVVEGTFSFDAGFRDDYGRFINMKSYYIGEGIQGVSYRSNILKITKHTLAWNNRLYYGDLRKKATEKLKEKLSPISSVLASGITLGDGSLLTKDIKSIFQKTSLSHILVASGYNISIVISQIVLVLGSGVVGSLISLFCIFLLILFYGGGASILRAGIMASLMIFRNTQEKNTQTLYILILACFLMLLQNPLLFLHSISWELSCFATMGILIFEPAIKNRLQKNFPKIPLYLSEIIIIPVAAFLGALPLIVEIFGSVSLLGIFLNIIVGIFLSFIYLGTLLFLILGYIIPIPDIMSSFISSVYETLYSFAQFFSPFSLTIHPDFLYVQSVFTWILWIIYTLYFLIYKK